MSSVDVLSRLADHARQASRITVLTGAGVSAASGVPTFRGEEGLWRRFRPEDLATADAFRRDPRLVWEWYAWRRENVAACRPNAAHDVLARWSRERGCTVVTQNVDDLHLVAGTERLIRLHGSLWELRCGASLDAAGRYGAAAPRDCGAEWRDDSVPLEALPPRCPGCGALARPAIVWFGEALRPADLEGARAATRCDLFITCGTSSLVYPAAGLVHEARNHGAITAEINPDATPASAAVDIAVRGAAEAVLPRVDLLLAP